MVAASLFSGIGAPEQARPDWQWLWHAEIEPFPAAVLAARHPGSVNLGDVSADDFAERAERAGRPDVLVFGSPCQSFSVAGKRLGLSDPRGNLALVALRIIERLKPHYFVFENVPGLVSSDNGNDLRIFCDTVAEIGYYIDIDILDAQEFGLAQRRERVFAVCENADLGRQKRTHSFASASLNCLIEMCLGVLAGHIGRFEHDGLELEPIGPYSVAGLKTKTKLFGLPLSQRGTGQEATAAWQSWLLALDEILATCPSERANSGSDSARLSDELLNIAGGRSRDTETAASCSNTSPSWSVFLAALWRAVNRSTTSTATNQTTHQEIFTCSLIVLRICERITRLTPLPEHYSDVASSALIAMRVFIAYARQTNNDLFESLHCGNDWFAYIPEAERAAGQLERSLGDWRGPAAVLSLAEGLRGYPAASREAGQDVTGALGARSCLSVGVQDADAGHLLSMCLNAHPNRSDAETQTFIAHTLRADTADSLIPGCWSLDLGNMGDGGNIGWRDGRQSTHTLDCNGNIGVAHTLRADGFDASEDGTGRGTPLVPVTDIASVRAASGGSSRSYVAQSLQSNNGYGIIERTLSESADADAVETDAGKALSVLRNAIGEEAFSEWSIGVLASFREAEILLRSLLRELASQRAVRREMDIGAHDGAKPGPVRAMRAMWSAGRARRSPPQPGPSRQSARELGAYLSKLPQQGAPPASLLRDLRQAALRTRILRDALSALEKARRSDESHREAEIHVQGMRQAQSGKSALRQALHASETRATQVRRLSVIECARLQGFPDTYAHIITKRWRKIGAEEARYLASHGLPVEERAGRWYTPVPADGPMYKAYGNSMAVPVLRWLLTRIEAHEAAMRTAA